MSTLAHIEYWGRPLLRPHSNAVAAPSRIALGLILALAFVSFTVSGARAEQGFVGMHIQGMSDLLADALGMAETKGVLVRDIALGGPAADAGFKRGDLIVQFNKKPVDTFETLVKLVQKTKPGKSYPVKVIRLGKTVDLTLTAGQWSRAWKVSKSNVGVIPEHGLTMASLTQKLRTGFAIPWGMNGVVVTLIDPKNAPKLDLQRGELIVQVNQQPVWEPDQVLKAFRAAKTAGRNSIMLLVDGIGGFRFTYLTTKAPE